MYLTHLNRLRILAVAAALALTLPFSARPLVAQRAVPAGTGDPFKDTAMLKPPAGAKVAIIEWQDLGCPACAHANPYVQAAGEHYHIPVERKDFPLAQHIWTFDAAVWARYLQDKVSPKMADDYRSAVFIAQAGIASKDDMLAFTRRFFQQHGLQMPFVPDPTGQLTREVKADYDLGMKLGVQHTPTIIVCNQHEWVQVTDVSMLYQTIDQLEADAGSSAPAKPVVKRTGAAKHSN